MVRQTETAAIKKAGAGKSSVFTRELTELYTKVRVLSGAVWCSHAQATMVGEEVDTADEVDALDAAPRSSFLMAVVDDGAAAPPGPACTIGIVAVNVATGLHATVTAARSRCTAGDVIYDEFSDGINRSELETRVVHIDVRPACLRLISRRPADRAAAATGTERAHRSAGLAAAGAMWVEYACRCGHHAAAAQDKIRLQRVRDSTDSTRCFAAVSAFYTTGVPRMQCLPLFDRFRATLWPPMSCSRCWACPSASSRVWRC